MTKDFTNKTFQKTLRGYSPEEVNEYLEFINSEFRKLERKCADSERKLVIALRKLDETSNMLVDVQRKTKDEQVASAKKAEMLFSEIISEAEKKANRIVTEAKKEAAKIISTATDTAEEIIDQTSADLNDAKLREKAMVASATEIYNEIESFRENLFALYNEHIESVESVFGKADRFMNKVEKISDKAEIEDEDDTEEDVYPEEYLDENDEDDVMSSIPEEDLYCDEDTEPEDDQEFDSEEYEEDELPLMNYMTEDTLYEDEDEDNASDFDDDSQYSDDFEDDWDEETAEEALTKGGFFDFSEGFEEVEEESEYIDPNADDFDTGSEDDPYELGDFFENGEGGRSMSLTDEFNLVFSNSNSRKNVDEIRKQTVVPPEEPSKLRHHHKNRHR